MTSRRPPARGLLGLLATLFVAGGAVGARADGPWPLEPPRLERLPVRAGTRPGGAEFAQRTTRSSGRERQRAALAELRRGNLPAFLRRLQPVRLSHRRPDGSLLTGTVWVTPDYLAIGSDDDFLRMPLSLPVALEICRESAFVLPTRKIVDAIYEQASVHLAPVPLTPGAQMRSSAYYLKHQELIEAQRAGHALGELVAGSKKDLVLTGRLHAKPGRVAIYGWHRGSGDPIQPLSTVHGARYVDYSHGVRLVSDTVLVEGEPMSIFDVLEDPALAPLLTYELTIEGFRDLFAP